MGEEARQRALLTADFASLSQLGQEERKDEWEYRDASPLSAEGSKPGAQQFLPQVGLSPPRRAAAFPVLGRRFEAATEGSWSSLRRHQLGSAGAL